jgi:hypothetical protein
MPELLSPSSSLPKALRHLKRRKGGESGDQIGQCTQVQVVMTHGSRRRVAEADAEESQKRLFCARKAKLYITRKSLN